MIEFSHKIFFIGVGIHLNRGVFIAGAVIAVNFALKKPSLVVFRFIGNDVRDLPSLMVAKAL